MHGEVSTLVGHAGDGASDGPTTWAVRHGIGGATPPRAVATIDQVSF